MSLSYPRGSEWRKWDLHVHTPASLVQSYGSDDDATWEKFITDLEALPPEYKVLGINDYLFIEGYKRLKREKEENGRLQNIDLLLPVIEFRIEKFAGVDFKDLKRINYHVIFSNEVTPDIIESQFLATLQQHYVLEASGKVWNRTITYQSMEELGASIKAGVPAEELAKYGSDAIEGFNSINIKEDQITSALKKDCFEGKYLTAVGKTEWDSLSWTDASIATKKSIINGVDLVFTSAESVEHFNNAKLKLQAQQVNDKLLDCSDAHRYSTDANKDRIGNSLTWIKADTTFEGLKQIIYEPEDRVFAGVEPPVLDRIRTNKTRYIDSLSLNKISTYKNAQGVWFNDVKIDFNKELVAIIGNKGSGKSAIADILGVLGNTHNAGTKHSNLSFLSNSKFRKKGYAENFNATLVWEDKSGLGTTIPLSVDVDMDKAEKVRYLPQHYFENLTNDIEGKGFDETLKGVIFLHVPEAQRLESHTFNDLIDIKSKSIEVDLTDLKAEIHAISEKIIKLEVKNHPSYKTKLKSLIDEKQKELTEHEKNKPQEVKDPSKTDEADKPDEAKEKKYELLQTLNASFVSVSETIQKKRASLIALTKERQQLSEQKNSLARIETQFSTYKSENRQKLKDHDLDIDEIAKASFNGKPIDTKISGKDTAIKSIENELKPKSEIDQDPTLTSDEAKLKAAYKLSLLVQQTALQEQIDGIKKDLSQPEKDFQEYKERLGKWEKKKKEIEGSETEINTLKFYKNEENYIKKNLIPLLAQARKDRVDKAIEIFNKKKEIIALYATFKQSIDNEIKKDKEFTEVFKMEIDVNFKLSPRFPEHFLQFINKTKRGTFYSAGEKDVEELFLDKNLLDQKTITSVLDEVIECLEHDRRELGDTPKDRQISDQVLRVQGFYDFIFSLDYLKPIYELKLDGKTLDELSPGEKGTLLLVFYLMIDREDIPLIIDQPEDNLDNKSVFQVLTRFIKSAKKRRQIIIVTHNPNLAVGADAEQIIYVALDKKGSKNVFSHEIGSIENPQINNRLVEILEGTMPAFDKRKLRYRKEA